MAISNVTDAITRNKLLLLHSHKNIDPTDRVKRAVNNITVESIELALMKREVKQDDDMKLFHKVTMCASVTKNGFTANEVKKELMVNTAHFYRRRAARRKVNIFSLP